MIFSDMSVELIDFMGSDTSVVNAARVSFAKQVSPPISEADERIIKFLAEHNHWSPFAHAFLSFRIKAPIFVARQLVKHQVGLSWNEESRRYIDSEPEFYKPHGWRVRHENKKQGSCEDQFIDFLPSHQRYDDNISQWVPSTPNELLEDSCDTSLEHYNVLLAVGVAPEQARMILPQNTMTNWIWSGSLYAFARVCNLRLDSHAQLETRRIAADIHAAMLEKFPVCTKYIVRPL